MESILMNIDVNEMLTVNKWTWKPHKSHSSWVWNTIHFYENIQEWESELKFSENLLIFVWKHTNFIFLFLYFYFWHDWGELKHTFCSLFAICGLCQLSICWCQSDNNYWNRPQSFAMENDTWSDMSGLK